MAEKAKPPDKPAAPEPIAMATILFRGNHPTSGEEYSGSDGPHALNLVKGQEVEVRKSTADRLCGTWPKCFQVVK